MHGVSKIQRLGKYKHFLNIFNKERAGQNTYQIFPKNLTFQRKE